MGVEVEEQDAEAAEENDPLQHTCKGVLGDGACGAAAAAGYRRRVLGDGCNVMAILYVLYSLSPVSPLSSYQGLQ